MLYVYNILLKNSCNNIIETYYYIKNRNSFCRVKLCVQINSKINRKINIGNIMNIIQTKFTQASKMLSILSLYYTQ